MSEPIHCPTCGCPVKVGGKGTTRYYVPIRSEAADALLAAAKTTCLHFKRMSLYPEINFMGDDEHEAWRLLRTAISAYEEERDGRKG